MGYYKPNNEPSILLMSKALFASLEGKGFGNKERPKVEEIEDSERRGFWGVIYLHNTKTS